MFRLDEALVYFEYSAVMENKIIVDNELYDSTSLNDEYNVDAVYSNVNTQSVNVSVREVENAHSKNGKLED